MKNIKKKKQYHQNYYLNLKNKYCCEICKVNFFSNYDKLKHERTMKHKNLTFVSNIQNN